MPAAPCAEGWSRGRTEARGGCGGEDRCNHGSQHHPLRCSLSPAPVITAGRKEGRPPGSDAPAAGSPFLPPASPVLSCPPYVRPEVPCGSRDLPHPGLPLRPALPPRSLRRRPARPPSASSRVYHVLPAPDPWPALQKDWGHMHSLESAGPG